MDRPDDVFETIDWMIAQGYLEFHPDDAGQPERDRRLRITPEGELHKERVLGRMAQRENAYLS